MSIGASSQFRSRAAWLSLRASCLFRMLMVVALCFAGFVTPMPATAATTVVDCASMHAGPDDDAQRVAHPLDAASCCLFHCIPAVPLLALPIALPVRASLRVSLGGNEPVHGVTPAIVVPPPRA